MSRDSSDTSKIGTLSSAMYDSVSSAGEEASEGAKKILGTSVKKGAEGAEKILSTSTEGAKKAANGVSDGAQKVANGVKSAANGAQKTGRKVVDTVKYAFDDSDVSEIGTLSSEEEHSDSEERETEQVPEEQSTKESDFRKLLKHREPYKRPEPKSPEPGPSGYRRGEHFVEPDRFVVNYEPLKRIMMEKDISTLRGYIEENFMKIASYEYLFRSIIDLIKMHAPKGSYVGEPHGNPGMLVSELRKLLKETQKKWAMFDVSMKDLGVLKGSQITAKILASKDRISEVLDAAYKRVFEAEEKCNAKILEALDLQKQVETLKKKFEFAQKAIKELKGEHLVGEPPTSQEFLEGLQVELHLQENLNSSLNEEIQRERRTNKQLWEDIIKLEQKYTEEQEKKAQELSEVAKDVELNEGLKKSILEKIKQLTADPDEVKKAVNDWMKAINEAIQQKQQKFKDLSANAKNWDDRVAKKQAEVNKLKEQTISMESGASTLQQQIRKKNTEVNNMQENYAALVARVNFMQKQYHEKASRADEMSDTFYSFTSTDTPKTPLSRFKYKAPKKSFWRRPPPEQPKGAPPKKDYGYKDDLGTLYELPGEDEEFQSPLHYRHGIPEDSDESPEYYRTGSPESHVARPAEGSPFSFESTPSGRRQSPTDEGPIPFDLSQPSPFSPRNAPIDPSTQNLGEIRSRFDVGKSFNMQTTHGPGSSPYRQVTRVDSSLSPSGSDRMLDSPLSVNHTAELTPGQYKTPFIAKSRFGYTDPTARELNLPPDPGFIVPTGFKKTIVLTSPKRKEPLLVNIDVEPKPLTETEDGEHFLCDISLNLQQQKTSSPVFTYDEPPEVTPTSARRHGLFTPRGIFKKRHYNVRRVHWPDQYQSPNLPWSPPDFPDARSPISSLYPSPYISDSSVPWERGPDSSDEGPMDRTFDASPQGAMNRTFDKSPSPMIKGQYYGRSPETDSSYDSSPYEARMHRLGRSSDSDTSPMIKGPSYRGQAIGLRRPFERSEPDEMPSQSSRSPSPGLNRTFDRSSSPESYEQPPLNTTFDKSSSPKYDSTPQSTGPYRQSAASRLDGTYNRSPSSPSGSSYESPYHQSGSSYESPYHQSGSSYGSPYTHSGSSYESPYAHSGSSSNGSPYHQPGRSSSPYHQPDRSSSPYPPSGSSSNGSPYYQQGRSSSESPYPQSGSSYNGSPYSRQDSSYSGSSSMPSNGSNNESFLNGNFHQEGQGRLNETFDRDVLNQGFREYE